MLNRLLLLTTILNMTPEEFKKNNIRLNFEGLETYGDVFMNDSIVLQANNMFRSWEINITPYAKLGENLLKVLLHSPIKKGLELSNSETAWVQMAFYGKWAPNYSEKILNSM